MRYLLFRAEYQALFVVLSLLLTISCFADNAVTANKFSKNSSTHFFPFIENSGQYNSDVRFYSRNKSGTTFVTEDGNLVYAIQRNYNPEAQHIIAINESFPQKSANPITGARELSTSITNIHGKTWKKATGNLRAYNSVNLGEIAEGINLHLNSNQSNVEKIFTINPGVDPALIKAVIDGCTEIKVNAYGELLIVVSSDSIKFTAPFAYQEFENTRKSIDVKYWVSGNTYGFSVGTYDTSRPLIIDPMLASTYLGGSNTDDAYEPAIQIDSQGYVYVTGFTYSTDFPTTLGVLDSEFTGFPSMERFVTKYSPDLSEIIASTFIGGSGDDWGMGICFDEDDNLYLGGYTSSGADFPLTEISYVSENLGGLDVYIIKITNDLTTLLASTIFGGSLDDGFQWPRMNLAVGQNGDVYATGLTKSSDFPFTPGAYDSTYAGGFNNNGGDAFVVRFNSSLSELLASTYLGGAADEWRVDLVLDSNDNVFVSGSTFSTEFPTTESAYDPTFNTSPLYPNNFITKFSSDLTTILASTFIETDGAENPLGIVIDSDENICISGFSTSNHPTTVGAFDRTFNGIRDAYITVLDNDLENILHSTLVGGSGFDMGHDLEIDSDGNFYLTGSTTSTDLPPHPENNAYDPSFNGEADIFIVKLDGELSTLLASTYVGGIHTEEGLQIAVGNSGNIYVVGNTTSTDFPTTPDSQSPQFNGGESDCFVFRITPDLEYSDIYTPELEFTPSTSSLLGNFPNPFNSQTRIEFSLDKPSLVQITIFDISGRQVKNIIQNYENKGFKHIVWNGTGMSNEEVCSGIYFYNISTDQFNETGKMILMK